MKNLIACAGLSTLATLAESVARLVTPSRQLCVRHSHGFYGTRDPSHFNVYRAAPGWLFIEMGSWTVEASWSTRSGLSRLKFNA
jgi:hypothetical protein